MAKKRVTDLTEIVEVAKAIVLLGIDTDDLTDSATGTAKRFDVAKLPLSDVQEAAIQQLLTAKADLDGNGKVPADQIPDAVLGALDYRGTWNANTNNPTIPAAAIGNKGHYYKVSVEGTTNIDGINEWDIGDWIISNGTTWDKLDNTDKVNSVNGKTGNVVLGKGNVGLDQVDNTSDADKPVSTAQAIALADKISKDFGIELEANGIANHYDGDLNNLTNTGPYRGGHNVTNKSPDSDSREYYYVIKHSDDYITQLAFTFSNNNVARRCCINGVWGSWVSLLDTTDKTALINTINNLTKSDVGLSNVDNTSDADKPISDAVAAALDGKAPSGHGHFGDEIELDGYNLEDAINNIFQRLHDLDGQLYP